MPGFRAMHQGCYILLVINILPTDTESEGHVIIVSARVGAVPHSALRLTRSPGPDLEKKGCDRFRALIV